MKQENTKISICKGIAIILIVVGHAEAPDFLTRFIYLFHMPIFFITAGYFFRRATPVDAWQFVGKRFRGLYVPMVKWALLFLIFHNLFFDIGLLNEQYGNWEGGVTHPYTWTQGCQRFVSIVFAMGGYDEFLLGAFWFFRALLISSILFMAVYKLFDERCPRLLRGNRKVWLIIAIAVAFAVFRLANGLKVTNVVQGGIRENWGVIFFGIGVLFRSYESRIRQHWALALTFFALLIGATALHCKGMNLQPQLIDVLTLPLTGTIGFLLTYYLSGLIDRRPSKVRTFLVHCGRMTVYIYVFHIIAFKAVSALKILWYDLPWGEIGCHMVIHDHNDDLFWLLYSAAGVAIPLLWMQGYKRVKGAVVARRSKGN